MSTWTILAVPERMKQDVRKLQVKSTPYSQQDNLKSKHGTPITTTLTSQTRNVQSFLAISGTKFSTRFVADLTNLSKRGCLACVAQMWDPMGFATPCTIELRIDLQELWSAGYSWDEILPEEIRTKVIRNIQILNQLLTYDFDRKLEPDNAVGLPEIHGFCDGGEKAYGAVMFLRRKLANSNYSCVPLVVKALVAPLKKKSIPRLELMGCLMLSRLYSTCKEALEFAVRLG